MSAELPIKPVIPRQDVHGWLTDITDNRAAHRLAIASVVKRQRRLGKYIKNNAKGLGPKMGVSGAYAMAAVGRVFELAGGRLVPCTAKQIKAAEARIAEVAVELFPPDEGFAERLHQVDWRAQPHILDEMLDEVLGGEDEEDEGARDPLVLAQLFLLVWLAVEVLQDCWVPDDEDA